MGSPPYAGEYNYEGETHHDQTEPYIIAVICSSYSVFRRFVQLQAQDRGYNRVLGSGARQTVGPFLFCFVNSMMRAYGLRANDWAVEGPAFTDRYKIIEQVRGHLVTKVKPAPKKVEHAPHVTRRAVVYVHVGAERDFQDKLFPGNNNLEPQDFLHIIQEYVDQGRKKYVRSKDGTAASIQLRHVMRKIAALAVASLEFNGSAHPKTDPRNPLI